MLFSSLFSFILREKYRVYSLTKLQLEKKKKARLFENVEPTVTDRREEVPMTNGNKCGI